MTTITLNQAAIISEKLKQDRLRQNKKRVIAFDLDSTLIDSSHRCRTTPDGQFDMDFWKANSVWEEIQKDTLLPLYFDFLNYKEVGYTVIAVTAREMSDADYRYLDEHGLHFDLILSRGNSKELDDVLKHKLLENFFKEENRTPYLFFDDKDDNLEVASHYGFIPVKAQFCNLTALVKDYHAIRNVRPTTIKVLKPKKEDLDENRTFIHHDTVD